MILPTLAHRKYVFVLLAAVVIVMLLVGNYNYAYNNGISRQSSTSLHGKRFEN
jgi:hypothetical protein